ncbi:MAG: hypothetical protein IJ217_03775 [Clostridia bacterium]|nr:hypothetical protein [Clostridia bacterium]
MKRFISIILIAIIATATFSCIALADGTYDGAQYISFTVREIDLGKRHDVRTEIKAGDKLVYAGPVTNGIGYGNNRRLAAQLNDNPSPGEEISGTGVIGAFRDDGRVKAAQGYSVIGYKFSIEYLEVYLDTKGEYYLLLGALVSQRNDGVGGKSGTKASTDKSANTDKSSDEFANPTISSINKYALSTIDDGIVQTASSGQTNATSDDVKEKYNFIETKDEVANPTLQTVEVATPNSALNNDSDETKSKYGF